MKDGSTWLNDFLGHNGGLGFCWFEVYEVVNHSNLAEICCQKCLGDVWSELVVWAEIPMHPCVRCIWLSEVHGGPATLNELLGASPVE